MPIEINTNFDAKGLGEKLLSERKQKLEVALSDAVTEIVLRTKSGKSASGGSFVQLSPKYKKFKILTGRRGIPDLNFSGNMLRAIHSKVEMVSKKLVGTIFFNSTIEAEKARGNMKLRQFFELSKEQLSRIIRKLT